MSRLKKPYFRRTEVGIEVTIEKRGKNRVLKFNKPVVQLELSEEEAHNIGWHLDPKSHVMEVKTIE